MRISRNDLNMNMALLVSKRATCLRAEVGAIILLDGRVASTGYNGPLPNTEHCDDHVCDLSKPCTRAVHAEANAIYNAARQGIPLEGAEMFCTYRPCEKCFEAIVQSGIKKVFYLHEYKTDKRTYQEVYHRYFMQGIKLEQLEDFNRQVLDEK